MTFKKGEKKPNQGKRGPGKATKDAREAIGAFVDGNAHRLNGWLDKVAEGVLAPDKQKYVIEPNPAKAFELFQSVVEYHIPKLARVDGDVKHSGAVGLNLNVKFD